MNKLTLTERRYTDSKLQGEPIVTCLEPNAILKTLSERITKLNSKGYMPVSDSNEAINCQTFEFKTRYRIVLELNDGVEREINPVYGDITDWSEEQKFNARQVARQAAEQRAQIDEADAARKARIAAIMPEACANGRAREARKQSYIDKATGGRSRNRSYEHGSDVFADPDMTGCDMSPEHEADYNRTSAHTPARTLDRNRDFGIAGSDPVEVQNDPVRRDLPFNGSKLLPDATYTVVREDGTYRTIKISTKKDGDLAGKTIVSYLSGADNSKDYTGCAFYDKEKGRIAMWKKFRANVSFCDDIMNAVGVILQDPGKSGEAYAMQSGNCCICGRKLTVPTSLHRGMGPECASKNAF